MVDENLAFNEAVQRIQYERNLFKSNEEYYRELLVRFFKRGAALEEQLNALKAENKRLSDFNNKLAYRNCELSDKLTVKKVQETLAPATTAWHHIMDMATKAVQLEKTVAFQADKLIVANNEICKLRLAAQNKVPLVGDVVDEYEAKLKRKEEYIQQLKVTLKATKEELTRAHKEWVADGEVIKKLKTELQLTEDDRKQLRGDNIRLKQDLAQANKLYVNDGKVISALKAELKSSYDTRGEYLATSTHDVAVQIRREFEANQRAVAEQFQRLIVERDAMIELQKKRVVELVKKVDDLQDQLAQKPVVYVGLAYADRSNPT